VADRVPVWVEPGVLEASKEWCLDMSLVVTDGPRRIDGGPEDIDFTPVLDLPAGRSFISPGFGRALTAGLDDQRQHGSGVLLVAMSDNSAHGRKRYCESPAAWSAFAWSLKYSMRTILPF
jgi:hypothetical protein